MKSGGEGSPAQDTMVSTTAGSRFKEEKDDIENNQLNHAGKIEENLDVENTHDD